MIQTTDIRPVGENELLVTWEDNHRSLFSYFDLRLHCACAGCCDEMTGKRTLQPETIPLNIKPNEIEKVGRYAIKFHWSDGHRTGIYSFELLRKLCPCKECQEGKR